ncbi:MAG: hypothetical protein IT373_29465 [Polyangiaceae bacterium]|nr:hypothetical protein [Polyangiaceae bacterium]
MGVAGLLAAPQAASVTVRYRIEMPTQPDFQLPAAASVWLVSAAGAHLQTVLAPEAADFVAGSASWSTAWSEVVIDASAYSDDTMGIAIHAGDRTSDCGWGLPMPPSAMTLYVDSVTAQ